MGGPGSPQAQGAARATPSAGRYPRPVRVTDSVERVALALEALAGSPEGVGVTGLAEVLGVHKATASRLLGTLAVQIALGISTLLLLVPIALAAAHQAGAVLVFTAALFAAHSLRAA